MEKVLYVHGKYGSPSEALYYKKFFPNAQVIGVEYYGDTPWQAGKEINSAVRSVIKDSDKAVIICNSIGAYFCMCANVDSYLKKAYFISPIVDMEKLIDDMMSSFNVTPKELKNKGIIKTATGEELSWEYYIYAKNDPVKWKVPTSILYGSCDEITSFDSVAAFAKAHDASLTVMPGGKHWFHTKEQLDFLDNWLAGE